MLARTKTATHQYAKSQIKWIQKQLIPAAREARAHGGEVYVYVVPGGPPGEPVACDVLRGMDEKAGRSLFHQHSWREKNCPTRQALDTRPPASSCVPSVRLRRRFPTRPSELAGRDPLLTLPSRQTLNSRRICDLCSQPGQPYSIRTSEWEEHLRSKIHRR